MASSLHSPTPQERWHRFTAATVRAFHRYATWLVSLSWWRFGWYALVLIIVTGLLQKLPPFSLTYYETIVDSASHRKAKMRTPPGASATGHWKVRNFAADSRPSSMVTGRSKSVGPIGG